MKTMALILGLMLMACSGAEPSPSESEKPAQNQSELSSSQECAEAGGFCTKGNGCRNGTWHPTLTCDHDQGCCIPN